MKRLILDGRLATKQWDTYEAITGLDRIPAFYVRHTTIYPNDKMTDDFVNMSIRDKKLLKNCFAVVIMHYGITYYYWN
jgi:hypothetical protein